MERHIALRDRAVLDLEQVREVRPTSMTTGMAARSWRWLVIEISSAQT
jgi:hypothetical protein